MTIKQVSQFTWHLIKNNKRIASFSSQEGAKQYVKDNQEYLKSLNHD